MAANLYQRPFRTELVKIAGNPNHTWECLHSTAFVWRVTDKGKRKGDRQSLLALGDRAQDLGLKVMWLELTSKYAIREAKETEHYDANGIAVFIVKSEKDNGKEPASIADVVEESGYAFEERYWQTEQ